LPELPDLTVYLECLEARIQDRTLERVRVGGPAWLRSVDPPLAELEGRTVRGLRRLGKRVVIEVDGTLFLVLHLMITGRLRWKARGAKIPARVGLGGFDFPNGTLLVTEAGPKRRATLQAVRGEEELRRHDPGGLDVLEADLSSFQRAVTRENHTLKRTLTDPRLLSGIGNAYSDEILHRARLSPVKRSQQLTGAEIGRLYEAARDTLREWIERLRLETGDGFPEKVTAFREGMAVHGRYRKPCPVCDSPVQRIAYAGNETNYCATCQTGGKLLADRALSRLLRSDWPRTLEELELKRESLRSVGGGGGLVHSSVTRRKENA
jgi:formamidopyrimidine-DNA glycosylase